jgi:hypothetical protein
VRVPDCALDEICGAGCGHFCFCMGWIGLEEVERR